jgi:hypothetical protein
MKLTFKIAALLLVLTTVLPIFFACSYGGKQEESSSLGEKSTAENTTEYVPEETFLPDAEQKGVVTAPEEGAKIYNIIFSLATVPPVLAALDSIASGYETYALIERGKTYSGIEKIENFHNAGFDPANNLSNGFTGTEFNAMTEKLRELRSAEENSFFYIYAQDGTALRAAALCANAGIPLEDFHIYMCEDGSGSYKTIRETFIEDKAADTSADAPLNEFMKVLNEVGMNFTMVMAKQDNKNSDAMLKYDIKYALALSVLPNFTYWLQDKNNFDGILATAEKSKLPGIFGVPGFENTTLMLANLRFRTISAAISKLDETQKQNYLTLMYGDYYADTYAALTRTVRADGYAPKDKLVYIGARHAYYPKFASDEKYGIGGLEKGAAIPASYSALDAKYKNSILFPTAEDYNVFLSAINDAANYPEGAPADVIAEIKSECFNLYINYIYTLKFAYLLYGEEYDIILKGHPREVLGAYDEWNNRHTVIRTEGEGENAKETKYSFDKLLDRALIAFHAQDSVGKYIGTVPYGTAAENLAYLGVDITVCGLPSSTYSGLDPDVPVLFVMAETSEAIDGNDSQVKDRYNSGNLTYSDNGADVPCIFYNTGNTFKFISEILSEKGDKSASEEFAKLWHAWLSANRPGANDINLQGFAD